MIPSLVNDPAKLSAMKADMQGKPALAAALAAGDDAVLVAHYNATASPQFVVYKGADAPVRIEQIGDAIDATELDNLTSLKLQRLQTIVAYSGGSVNPSNKDRRDFYDKIFDGTDGTVTRPRLATLWKRDATVAEKLYATGTGTTASPATMSVSGKVTNAEMSAARNAT